METSILKALLNKEFYDDHRGTKCPTKIFSKPAQKIKLELDKAMDRYHRDLTISELEGLFMANNPTLTSSQKNEFKMMFDKIEREPEMGSDVAQEVLSKMFQQYVGEELANIGFDIVNGTTSSMEAVRRVMEKYNDDFTPTLNVEWDSIDIDSLLEANDLESRWKFNIPTLASKVDGCNGGHLIFVGARPNTGKTSFHASLIAGPGGFAHQGAKCVILCNEEAAHRVAARYLTAATGMTLREIRNDRVTAEKKYSAIKDNIYIKDSSGRDMAWVESVAKSMEPDILILDMGDKFATHAGFAREDQALSAASVYARVIGKQYNCAVFYMSQLSAEAEGKATLNQAMMNGSKTGKAAEADLMVLIGKDAITDGMDEESPQRYINIVKNKLTGWHGMVVCMINAVLGRYES
jgi:replicative DNA helicase